MVIFDLQLFRDGGTIGIYTDKGLTYRCNPGVWGTKACIGKAVGGSGYSFPPLEHEELMRLKIALSNFMPTRPSQDTLRNQILGVMNIEYGIQI